jgi:hypothetical protein
MAETYTFMAANNAWGDGPGIAALAEDDSNQDRAEEIPDWYVTWEKEHENASSRTNTWMSFVCVALAGFSVFITL